MSDIIIQRYQQSHSAKRVQHTARSYGILSTEAKKAPNQVPSSDTEESDTT